MQTQANAAKGHPAKAYFLTQRHETECVSQIEFRWELLSSEDLRKYQNIWMSENFTKNNKAFPAHNDQKKLV
jgi:hypothetical protein